MFPFVLPEIRPWLPLRYRKTIAKLPYRYYPKTVFRQLNRAAFFGIDRFHPVTQQLFLRTCHATFFADRRILFLHNFMVVFCSWLWCYFHRIITQEQLVGLRTAIREFFLYIVLVLYFYSVGPERPYYYYYSFSLLSIPHRLINRNFVTISYFFILDLRQHTRTLVNRWAGGGKSRHRPFITVTGIALFKYRAQSART